MVKVALQPMHSGACSSGTHLGEKLEFASVSAKSSATVTSVGRSSK